MAVETICTTNFNFKIIIRCVSHKSLITAFNYFHNQIKIVPKYEIIDLYLQRWCCIHVNDVTMEDFCHTRSKPSDPSIQELRILRWETGVAMSAC
jgi:hypothetical protein